MARRTGLIGSSQNDLFPPDGSIDAASPTSSPPTLRASGDTTSSPGSADGPLPLSLLTLLPTGASGLDPAHVSLSRRRDGAWVPTMHGICGPTSFASSTHAGPLASWENRLRERLAMVGSTESPLIWERRATPAGRSISRLRPWTPLKSGNGSTGPRSMARAWPAPTSLSFDQSHQPGNSRSMNATYDLMAGAAPWPAVQAAQAGAASRSGDRKEELLLQGMMRANTPKGSPWATPRSSDGEKGSTNQRFTGGGEPLPAQMGQTDMKARPRAAPRAGDWRSGASQVGAKELRPGGSMLPEQMAESSLAPATSDPGGAEASGSSATTAKRVGSPTPLHPCWLQGFPAAWLLGAALATRSSRRSRARSSPRSSKRKAKTDD